MTFQNFTELNYNQKEEVRALWNDEYPKQLALKLPEDLEKYLSALKDKRHILMLDEKNRIKGWYLDFKRVGCRNFAMIIHSEIQGNGHGSHLLAKAKEMNTELYGWVVDSESYKKADGSIYSSPLGFYLKNGFRLIPSERMESDILSTVRIKWNISGKNS